MKAEELSLFDFGDFRLWQSEELMKVSTDSRILAGVCSKIEYKNLLDVGCGIGTISFLLANCNKSSKVLGIDIQEKAIEIANLNRYLNPQIDNIDFCVMDFTLFQVDDLFDLIVSNPPYFINQLRPLDAYRDEFRHTSKGFIAQFCRKCKHISTKSAKVAICIPFALEKEWSFHMSQNEFVLEQLVEVRHKHGLETVLLICIYALSYVSFTRRQFVIYNESGGYSKDYLFYLQ